MPFQITILQRGLILVLVPFLIQATFAWLMSDLQYQQARAQQVSLRNKDVLVESRRALSLLLDEETGVRGYVITNDATFNEPYEMASQQLPASLRRLEALVADEPQQQTAIRSISAEALKLFEWHTRVVRQVGDGASTEAARAVKSGEGKRMMDELRRDFTAFIDTVEDAALVREAGLISRQQQLRQFVLGGTLASFIAMIALAFTFYRGISLRLGYLVENTQRMTEGRELLARGRGTDEIAKMDQAFHSMAENLDGARATAQEKMNLLQSILDSMGEGVVVADLSGKFLVFNPAAEVLLGMGATNARPGEWPEQYGLYLPDQVTPFPPEQVPLARALRNESVDAVEMFIRNTDNSVNRWISVNARPLLNARGEIAGGTAVFRDVSALKHSELQLRRSGEEIRDLYNNAPCGYHSLDAAGRFVAINDTELNWLGYERTAVLGRLTFLDVITDDSRALFVKEFPRFKAVGWIDNLEFTMVRKDGSTFPIVLNASAIRDAKGEYISSRSIVVDISDRKRAEQEIRRLNADLELRIEERTAELTETNRELQQKNKENEMFVYSVSHDLRSPLVNLQGFGQELGMSCADLRALFLEDGVAEGVRDRGLALLNGSMAKSLRYVQSGVLRLSNIIDGMLRLSRTGRVTYRWQKVDVNGLVVRIVESLKNTTEERQATITIQALENVWGDAAALEQVFANLITNAVNYLDPKRAGQIEVGCQTIDPDSRDSLRTFYVRDNGLGISAAYHAKVFQAFQRLHADAAAGEGIGLTIVQRIVERHRGKVWFESKVGQGSTFFVALPTEPAVDD